MTAYTNRHRHGKPTHCIGIGWDSNCLHLYGGMAPLVIGVYGMIWGGGSYLIQPAYSLSSQPANTLTPHRSIWPSFSWWCFMSNVGLCFTIIYYAIYNIEDDEHLQKVFGPTEAPWCWRPGKSSPDGNVMFWLGYVKSIPDICHQHHQRCWCQNFRPGVKKSWINAKNLFFTPIFLNHSV